MLDFDFVYSFCLEHLDKVSCHSNSINARCPICFDSKKSLSKKRFYLTYKNCEWIYHCFNCNTSGNFVGLYAHVKGLTYKEAYDEIYSFDKQIENFKKEIKVKKEEKKEIVEQHFNDILKNCLKETDKTDSLLYNNLIKKLKDFRNKRKIPYSHNLFVCYEGQFKNRIIIPVYKDENIVYFQARALSETQLPKYLNPEAEKSHIILNEDKFDKNKNIIICEGILDAFSISNGTTCLGASISDEFIEKLYEKTDKNVIIALDNDERGILETINIVNRSSFNEKLLYFVSPFKEKDFNEIIQKNPEINLYEIVCKNSYNKFELELKMKLEGVWYEISSKRETISRNNRRKSSISSSTNRENPSFEIKF